MKTLVGKSMEHTSAGEGGLPNHISFVAELQEAPQGVSSSAKALLPKALLYQYALSRSRVERTPQGPIISICTVLSLLIQPLILGQTLLRRARQPRHPKKKEDS